MRIGLKYSALLVVFFVLLAMSPVALAQGFDGDKVIFNEEFVLASNQTLDGNLVVMGGSARLESGSMVRGDVTVAGGTLEAGGEITGNLGIFGGRAVLHETAIVGGDFAAFGASVSRAAGAVIRGEEFSGLGGRNVLPLGDDGVFSDDASPVQQTRSWLERFILWQLGTFGLAVLLALLGLVLVLLAPHAMERIATTIASQAALSFGVGFLTLILAGLAGAILLIACGLGLLVWFALLVGWLLGWIAMALWLGQVVLRALRVQTASAVAEVILGVVLVTFASRVPWCGFLFGLVLGSLGLGAVVLTRFGTRDADSPSASGRQEAEPRRTAARGATFEELLAAERPAIASAPQLEAPTVSVESAPAALTAITGIDAALAERLAAGGVFTVADLASTDVVRLAELTGVTVGQILVEDWIGQAQRLL